MSSLPLSGLIGQHIELSCNLTIEATHILILLFLLHRTCNRYVFVSSHRQNVSRTLTIQSIEWVALVSAVSSASVNLFLANAPLFPAAMSI